MRRKRDIVIELTSLLDVIMIMIFMVMTENSKLTNETQAALESATRENEINSGKAESLSDQLDEALAKLDEGNTEELLERIRIAEGKLEGYEFINGVVTVINIELENRYNNTVRCLTFGTGDPNSPDEVFEIHNADELSDAVNHLKIFTFGCIDKARQNPDSAIVYIVFTYDARKVYQDDYTAVNEALKEAEIRANDGNVRYRLNQIA